MWRMEWMGKVFWIRLAKRDDPEVSGRLEECYHFIFFKILFFYHKGHNRGTKYAKTLRFHGIFTSFEKNISFPCCVMSTIGDISSKLGNVAI